MARVFRVFGSEEHTSELQSHYSISYAVFCLKKATTEIYTGEDTLSLHDALPICFLLFLYSRKASLEIFSELDETSRGSLFYQKTPDGVKKQRRGATGAPHATSMVWAPRGSSAAAISPTYSPRENNPKGRSHNPRKVPETPPPSTLAREGPEPLPGTLPERGIVTGGFYIAMPASGVMRE